MNTTETLITTIDHSMNRLADGEAALLAAQTSQDKFIQTAGMLAERVADVSIIAGHAADLATKIDTYVGSGNDSLAVAKSSLEPAARGTENPALLGALSHTIIASEELGGPQEAAHGCLEHAGMRLQTIGNLIGALTREITALQHEADTTSAHIDAAASSARNATHDGETYLNAIFGGSL